MRGSQISETRRARALRRNQTAAEALVWRALRGRSLSGFKFVRQEPVGPYFADFACREERLIVEVDGATHSTDTEQHRDLGRTAFLKAHGYRVLRVPNDEVYRNLEGALATIYAEFTGGPSS
jgi:very-short-patch-repair endonuclease